MLTLIYYCASLLLYACAAFSIGCLVYSVYLQLAIARYRRPDVSWYAAILAISVLFSNIYTEEGQRIRTRYVRALYGFFAGCLAMVPCIFVQVLIRG